MGRGYRDPGVTAYAEYLWVSMCSSTEYSARTVDI